METNKDYIAEFDSLFTTNNIQKLKIINSITPTSKRNINAAFIKLLEFEYCKNKADESTYNNSSENYISSPTELINAIYVFCTPDEQEKLDTLKSQIETYENMMDTFELFKTMQEFNSATATDDDSNNASNNDNNKSDDNKDNNFSFENILNMLDMLSAIQ